jgi:integrase
LRSIFKFSVAEDYIEKDPSTGLFEVGARHGATRLKAKKDKRPPYSQQDLETIFYSEDYKALPFVSDRRWLPILSLFHGFRMNEICQLEVGDVRYEENILVIDIKIESDEDEEELANKVVSESEKFNGIAKENSNDVKKRLKNEGSARRVPVHPKIIAAGFEQLVENARKMGEKRVFYMIPPDSKGYYSGIFSKRWTQFTKDFELTNKAVFHSLRHNFKDAAEAADVPDKVWFRIAGWSRSEVGHKYGKGLPIPILLQSLRKIDFPFLDLKKAGFPVQSI